MSKHIPICTQILKIILNHKCFIFMVLNTFLQNVHWQVSPIITNVIRINMGLFCISCCVCSGAWGDMMSLSALGSYLRVLFFIWGLSERSEDPLSCLTWQLLQWLLLVIPNGASSFLMAEHPACLPAALPKPLTALHVTAVTLPTLLPVSGHLLQHPLPTKCRGRQLAPILTHILLVLVLIQVLSSYYSMTLEFLKTCYAKLHTKKRGTWGGKIRGTAVTTVPVHHVKKKTYWHIFAY